MEKFKKLLKLSNLIGSISMVLFIVLIFWNFKYSYQVMMAFVFLTGFCAGFSSFYKNEYLPGPVIFLSGYLAFFLVFFYKSESINLDSFVVLVFVYHALAAMGFILYFFLTKFLSKSYISIENIKQIEVRFTQKQEEEFMFLVKNPDTGEEVRFTVVEDPAVTWQN